MQNLQYNHQTLPISSATFRNWTRLKTNSQTRLIHRANKSKSTKKIIPTEYFSFSRNVVIVEKLLEYITKNNISIQTAIYSLAKNMLTSAKIAGKKEVRAVLQNFSSCITDTGLLGFSLPVDEYDFLGLIYQCLLLEGKKNSIGSYYTPQKIVQNMTSDFDFSHNETFFDPCCGSGAFLLSLTAENPLQIFGMDNDFIAVFIAKINLLIKYKDIDFIPQIFCADYLSDDDLFVPANSYKKMLFDYIATNPPWGAISQKNTIPKITSKETFSCFFVKSFSQLKERGSIRFLFPESILNVKVHKDIRSFMLNNGSLASITKYEENFSGVVTNYVDIAMKNEKANKALLYTDKKGSRKIPLATFLTSENFVFNALDNIDRSIIEKIKRRGNHFLTESIFALGIVTGDNKGKLFQTLAPDLEKIYTGKEIQPFVLKPAKNYIHYDRSQFQQVASDEIYRAKEKLVYKFISNKLTFAYDDTRSLFLNSANILIPNVPNMSTKTVMAFLNSEIYQYLYIKLFGEIKILKGNLLQLPFPNITENENEKIIADVNSYMSKPDEKILSKLNSDVYAVFDFSDNEIQHIRSVLNGKID